MALSEHAERFFFFFCLHPKLSFRPTKPPPGPKPILINSGILPDHCCCSTGHAALEVIKCWSRSCSRRVFTEGGKGSHKRRHVDLTHNRISCHSRWSWAEHPALPARVCGQVFVYKRSAASISVRRWPDRQRGYGWTAAVSVRSHNHKHKSLLMDAQHCWGSRQRNETEWV